MKNSILSVIALSVPLLGCTDKAGPTAQAPAADTAAGKIIAERDCKACHGLDGKGIAPAIPNLAAQRERYLLASFGPEQTEFYGSVWDWFAALISR